MKIPNYLHLPGQGAVNVGVGVDAGAGAGALITPAMPPCTVEVRLGASADGGVCGGADAICWLWRTEESAGAWMECGLNAHGELQSFQELKDYLSATFPLHVVVWAERDRGEMWEDA